jgi:hypothetical protein
MHGASALERIVDGIRTNVAVRYLTGQMPWGDEKKQRENKKYATTHKQHRSAMP